MDGLVIIKLFNSIVIAFKTGKYLTAFSLMNNLEKYEANNSTEGFRSIERPRVNDT